VFRLHTLVHTSALISLITRENSNVKYGVILILWHYCQVSDSISNPQNVTQICYTSYNKTWRSQNLDTSIEQETKVMGRGNLLDWSITDRRICFASELMKTTWDHNSDTWKYCSVMWRYVCTLDKNYWRFGGTTSPILHPKHGCRFLAYSTHQYRRK
jgi:hypothetical protein